MEGVDEEQSALKQRGHQEKHHHPDHYQHGHQDRKDVDLRLDSHMKLVLQLSGQVDDDEGQNL